MSWAGLRGVGLAGLGWEGLKLDQIGLILGRAWLELTRVEVN